MPLSERERALLEQMEQALSAEDPRFASHMRNHSAAGRRRLNLVLGAVGVLVGLGVVLLGVTMQSIPVGVVGFLVMVAAGVWALRQPKATLSAVPEPGQTAPRPSATRSTRGRRPKRGTTGGSGSFMQRMELRWDRRRERGDF